LSEILGSLDYKLFRRIPVSLSIHSHTWHHMTPYDIIWHQSLEYQEIIQFILEYQEIIQFIWFISQAWIPLNDVINDIIPAIQSFISNNSNNHSLQ
jgi:hypothetical protein